MSAHVIRSKILCLTFLFRMSDIRCSETLWNSNNLTRKKCAVAWINVAVFACCLTSEFVGQTRMNAEGGFIIVVLPVLSLWEVNDAIDDSDYL